MESYKGKNIAITGGAGFIGSHLTEKLLSLGANVLIIDNLLYGNKASHLIGNKLLRIEKTDVRDAKAMPKLLDCMDLVFHLAAIVGVEETQLNPYEVLDVEIGGTVNLLRACTIAKVKRLIFGSSSEVYGDSKEPMKENSCLAPRSTYAVAKLVGEEYCRAYYLKHRLNYTILRYFNIYGPRQDERFVISRFIKQTMTNEPIRIYGDGKQTRDFTFIDDTIEGTLLAAKSSKAIGEAFNIGTRATTSINELASEITGAIANKKIKPEYVDYDKTRPREIEVYNRLADVSKAESILKYTPTVALREGIKRLLNSDKRFSVIS
jgi:UDP-glucose 4-epimerase